jgi:hypothetical protein
LYETEYLSYSPQYYDSDLLQATLPIILNRVATPTKPFHQSLPFFTASGDFNLTDSNLYPSVVFRGSVLFSSSSDPGSNSDQSRLPTGMLTGIVVGVMICLLFIIAAILFFVFRSRKSDSSDASGALSTMITETTSITETSTFEAEMEHAYENPLTSLGDSGVFVASEDEFMEGLGLL